MHSPCESIAGVQDQDSPPRPLVLLRTNSRTQATQMIYSKATEIWRFWRASVIMVLAAMLVFIVGIGVVR